MKALITVVDSVIEIDMFDNDFNKELSAKIPYALNWELLPKAWPHTKKWNTALVHGHWSNLRNSYYKLLEYIKKPDHLNVPETLADPTNNYYTNQLHRIFTNARQHNTFLGEPIEITDEVFKVINQINDSCHEIEPYIINKTVSRWMQNKITCLEVQCKEFNAYTIIEAKKYIDLVTQDADVYAIKHITGKDFMFSYFNEDIPDSWDVNNGHITYCGFCIDYDGSFKRLWNDPDFNNWLVNGGYKGPIGFIPIGTISDDTKSFLKKKISEELLYGKPSNVKLA